MKPRSTAHEIVTHRFNRDYNIDEEVSRPVSGNKRTGNMGTQISAKKIKAKIKFNRLLRRSVILPEEYKKTNSTIDLKSNSD